MTHPGASAFVPPLGVMGSYIICTSHTLEPTLWTFQLGDRPPRGPPKWSTDLGETPSISWLGRPCRFASKGTLGVKGQSNHLDPIYRLVRCDSWISPTYTCLSTLLLKIWSAPPTYGSFRYHSLPTFWWVKSETWHKSLLGQICDGLEYNAYSICWWYAFIFVKLGLRRYNIISRNAWYTLKWFPASKLIMR